MAKREINDFVRHGTPSHLVTLLNDLSSFTHNGNITSVTAWTSVIVLSTDSLQWLKSCYCTPEASEWQDLPVTAHYTCNFNFIIPDFTFSMNLHTFCMVSAKFPHHQSLTDYMFPQFYVFQKFALHFCSPSYQNLPDFVLLFSSHKLLFQAMDHLPH
jgi:hypothetical protein